MSQSPYTDNITFDPELKFTLDGKYKKLKPTGLAVHSTRFKVYLNYQGLGIKGPSSFTLPTDPSALRRLAAALKEEADKAEKFERKVDEE